VPTSAYSGGRARPTNVKTDKADTTPPTGRIVASGVLRRAILAENQVLRVARKSGKLLSGHCVNSQACSS
jgi:hypothetical protein